MIDNQIEHQQIETYLKEYRPNHYQQLTKNKTLDQYLKQQVEKIMEMWYELTVTKQMDPFSVQEYLNQIRYELPPENEDENAT